MEKLPRTFEEYASDDKTIPLTKGKFAVVDGADYDWARNYKWQCDGEGYAARAVNLGNMNMIMVFMHRLIVRAKQTEEVDHIDGDKLNNRRSNLRIATRSQNQANRPKFNKRKYSSRYKGVSWHRRKSLWHAYITVAGKRTTLGYFENEIDAAKAYDKASFSNFGDFAYLNFPRGL